MAKNLFEKVESARKLLAPAISDLSDKEMMSVLDHCFYYRYGRRKHLSNKEFEVNELLLKHGLQPKTLYDWWRLLQAPDHIKKKLAENKINMKDASSMAFAYRKMITTRKGKEIVADIKAVIGGLEWKDKNSI